jgi:O-antigen/teichoic acid export membrane protein
MSNRIIKNVGSGLLAQFWMGILGLVALPVFARGLGADRYGLLALNLALINFAAVADLGVGRAASKYLAEDYERKEMFRTQQFVSTAMTVTVVTGLIGTAVLSLLSPILVDFAFRIPPGMQKEAKMAFWITGAGLLAVLLRILFDGILAGHHRIVVLNFGNLIVSTLRMGLSIAAILMGHSLLAVLIINVVMSYLHAAGLWWYTRRHFAGHVNFALAWDPATARQLLRLGLVSTLSFIMANIVFLYADRFIIAAFLPLALTGYYTMAFDISSRQAYVSNSVAATFFPVFSGHGATSGGDLERSYLNAMKAVAVGTTGLAMLLIVFCRPLLTYWIAPSFSTNGASSLMVLAIACLFSTYVQILYTLIIAASSNPGVCVRVFSIAIAFHVGLSLVFLRFWSIVGVAAAFAVAYLLVFCYLLWWVSKNLVRISVPYVLRHCFLGSWTVATALGVALRVFVLPAVHNLIWVLATFAAGYLVYLGCCTMIAYSSQERGYIRDLVRNRFRSSWRRSLALLGGEP